MTVVDHPTEQPAAALSGAAALADNQRKISSPDVQRRLRGYLTVLCEDCTTVEDLAQEVALRGLQRMDRLHDPGKLLSFLYGIARHVVQEQDRRRRRDQFSARLAAETIALREDWSARLGHGIAVEELRAAIARLPLVSRRILELRYTDELNASQIGRRMNINPPAVRACLRRIRQHLQRELG